MAEDQQHIYMVVATNAQWDEVCNFAKSHHMTQSTLIHKAVQDYIKNHN